MGIELVLDPHRAVVERVHQDMLDLAGRERAAFPGLVVEPPLPRLLDQIAADREAALGIVLEEHTDEKSALGIVHQRAFAVGVMYVQIAQRRLNGHLYAYRNAAGFNADLLRFALE